mmetsp:Transcript_18887/g.45616  ORF Transcript_18887/g.45616 Transcript_18887/m.45616 type:complete len:518 (-) Transcript_18887:228-1781(-)
MCYVEEDADPYDIVPFYFGDPAFCENGGRFGDQGWIVGNGIDLALLSENRVNRRRALQDGTEYPIDILDAEHPNTPVLILDSLDHGAVVNSEAMRRVGYDQLIGDPPGGKIDRDPTTGRPTGIVRENAQQVFRNAAFPPTEANQQVAYDSLLNALGRLASNGVTTVSDAGGFWKQAQTEAWARAEADGVLTVRASNALYIYPDIPMSEQLADLTSRYSNDPNALVRFNQAKIYVDGILSLTTSALKEPYLDSLQLPQADQLGMEYFGNSVTLLEVSRQLSNAGFQLHYHVTGDRGAETALDMIEAVGGATSPSGPHRLTHCYLVDSVDRPRFAELGAFADFQLAPSSLGQDYEDFISSVIGPERSSELLPALDIHQAGGQIVLSSDWDADDLSPLIKLQSVLTRRDGKAIPDLTTTIRMMTIEPARLLQHDDKTGSITKGKKADMVVIDQNIFEMDPSQISQASIVATIFDGALIYDPNGIFGDPTGTVPPDGATSHSFVSMLVASTSVALVTWFLL